MKKAVADTSVVISLLTSEKERQELLPMLEDYELNLDLSREEIVSFVQEGHNRLEEAASNSCKQSSNNA